MTYGSLKQTRMGETEFAAWREFIWRRCGLDFPESRIRFLSRCLWERVRRHAMTGYSELFYYVQHDPDGEYEWKELLELLAIKETSFFRHPPSFEALMTCVLPQLMRDKRKQGANLLTIWSAGCSAGQEAYSLAMAFLEVAGGQLWEAKISGTDLSLRALEKARRGRYRPHDVRRIPQKYCDGYMRIAEDEQGVFYQVADHVQAMVRFTYADLTALDDSQVALQDVIFCQNVLIYFKPDHRIEIVRQLCRRLNVGGYLFLAPAEVVGLRLAGVEPVVIKDALIYRRVR